MGYTGTPSRERSAEREDGGARQENGECTCGRRCQAGVRADACESSGWTRSQWRLRPTATTSHSCEKESGPTPARKKPSRDAPRVASASAPAAGVLLNSVTGYRGVRAQGRPHTAVLPGRGVELRVRASRDGVGWLPSSSVARRGSKDKVWTAGRWAIEDGPGFQSMFPLKQLGRVVLAVRLLPIRRLNLNLNERQDFVLT
ncbi:hypothetical protein B0H13DRAFT_2049952 [Mycena leptocephala]|nr:hypothetical protein B0H13DRAFT_2049952 [Mycena leptocephala]